MAVSVTKFSKANFWDDQEHTIVKAIWGLYEFITKTGENKGSQNGLVLTLKTNDDTHTDFWSYGDREGYHFIPSDDGKFLDDIGTRTEISDQAGAGRLLQSCIEAGFPVTDMDEMDIGFLNGLVFIGKSISAPTDDNPDRTVRVVDTIVALPKGEKGVEDEVETTAITLVEGAIKAAENKEIAKKDLLASASKSLRNNPDRRKITTLLTDDTWLGDSDLWTYADGVIS